MLDARAVFRGVVFLAILGLAYAGYRQYTFYPGRSTDTTLRQAFQLADEMNAPNADEIVAKATVNGRLDVERFGALMRSHVENAAKLKRLDEELTRIASGGAYVPPAKSSNPFPTKQPPAKPPTGQSNWFPPARGTYNYVNAAKFRLNNQWHYTQHALTKDATLVVTGFSVKVPGVMTNFCTNAGGCLLLPPGNIEGGNGLHLAVRVKTRQNEVIMSSDSMVLTVAEFGQGETVQLSVNNETSWPKMLGGFNYDFKAP